VSRRVGIVASTTTAMLATFVGTTVREMIGKACKGVSDTAALVVALHHEHKGLA
jgi:hypothetical protein